MKTYLNTASFKARKNRDVSPLTFLVLDAKPQGRLNNFLEVKLMNCRCLTTVLQVQLSFLETSFFHLHTRTLLTFLTLYVCVTLTYC